MVSEIASADERGPHIHFVETQHARDISSRFAKRRNAVIAIHRARPGVVCGDSAAELISSVSVTPEKQAQIMRSTIHVLLGHRGIDGELLSRLRHKLHQANSSFSRERGGGKSRFGGHDALDERWTNAVLRRCGANDFIKRELDAGNVQSGEFQALARCSEDSHYGGDCNATAQEQKERCDFQRSETGTLAPLGRRRELLGFTPSDVTAPGKVPRMSAPNG